MPSSADHNVHLSGMSGSIRKLELNLSITSKLGHMKYSVVSVPKLISFEVIITSAKKKGDFWVVLRCKLLKVL